MNHIMPHHGGNVGATGRNTGVWRRAPQVKKPVRLTIWLAVALTGALCACQPGGEHAKWWEKKQPQSKPETQAIERAEGVGKAIEGTIASVAYVRGLRKMRVRGYGLVVGLGRNGSRDCPPQIRRYLVQEVAKRYRLGTVGSDTDVTPEKLIADLDTAVVLITGAIPAAAQRGARFDVQVQALARSQTRSLAGGRLYTCQLKLASSTGAEKLAEERTLAIARGPVFVNPFAEEAEGSPNGQRHRGLVLGGGVLKEPRRLQLVLLSPSYQMAARVRNRINERFGDNPKIADAISPSLINLRIPPQWVGREKHFLTLVMHLCLYDDAGAIEKRAAELAEEIFQPASAGADISLVWEGIGRTVLPVIRPLYAHRNRRASFYAARAGYRLGDEMAPAVLARHARDPGSSYRLEAIEVLGELRRGSAANVLEGLLADEDQRVRLAAYEALARLGSSKVESSQVGEDNYVLDWVDCEGGGMIWARRSKQQRIAVFGGAMWCLPPVFYTAADGALTISAEPGAGQLTLVRRTPFAGLVSEPIRASLSVKKLIQMLGSDAGLNDDGRVNGLGLSYAQVLEALSHLCRNGAIPAVFMLEQPSVADALGPVEPMGRPESEF